MASERDFDAFTRTLEREFMQHPVVTRNAYTAWFARGEMTLDELRAFISLRIFGFLSLLGCWSQ